jgi:hypothetical protein
MYTLFCQWHLAEKNGTKLEGSWRTKELSPLTITWDTAELHFYRPQLVVESELRYKGTVA